MNYSEHYEQFVLINKQRQESIKSRFSAALRSEPRYSTIDSDGSLSDHIASTLFVLLESNLSKLKELRDKHKVNALFADMPVKGIKFSKSILVDKGVYIFVWVKTKTAEQEFTIPLSRCGDRELVKIMERAYVK